MNSDIINQVVVLCLIMLFGLYARKKEYIKEYTVKNLTDILVNITLPCLILSSFNMEFSTELWTRVKLIFIYSLIIHIFLAIISKLFFIKYDENKKKILRFVTIFSNFGFMGYPIAESIYGKIGVFYASIFGIPFNIILLTYGVFLFSEEAKDNLKIRNIVMQPGILFVVIGTVIFLFSIKLPIPINKTINMVGSMTTPLSMMIVGASFAGTSLMSMLKDFKLYYISFIRLLIVPFITYLLLRFIKADDYLLKLCVILEAMPAAAMTTVFAEMYNSDRIFSAKCVFVTTVLSIFTIPLVITLL
ncbi:putative transporter YfdV [Clostridium liquoris]|uniref:Putative transporter YfdV n=1 Tax=Clostridium liquoris TaxID=1289519 RepID=A0A2T0B0Y5_9CLOT|nr:AEC family transporter [Clostridium liquoris]PRR77037.1 putative transporter YfdV [Clostridium liquoris]